jgi:hypothetical protein
VTGAEEQARLLFLLETAEREGHHLTTTCQRLFSKPIDTAWVHALDSDPEESERLDAFVARFGRLQDTLGNRLIPALLRQLLEASGSALDNLNRMEALGVLSSVDQWIEARNLRNRMIHEYMRDAEEFARVLCRARELVPLLTNTYNAIRSYAAARLESEDGWPPLLDSFGAFGGGT